MILAYLPISVIDISAKLGRIVASRTEEERRTHIRDLVEEVDRALSCPHHEVETIGCEICRMVRQARAEISRMPGRSNYTK